MQVGSGYWLKLNNATSFAYPENSSRSLIKLNSSSNSNNVFKIQKNDFKKENSTK
jgi:hypothetical protein